MTAHPYQEYLSFEAWEIIADALEQLEINHDLERKTNSEYIVGYLLKALDKRGLLKNHSKSLS